jgi:hypothetical protein
MQKFSAGFQGCEGTKTRLLIRKNTVRNAFQSVPERYGGTSLLFLDHGALAQQIVSLRENDLFTGSAL